MRALWKLGVFGLLLVLMATSGCSVRHPSYMTESQLVAAEDDSLSLDDYLALPTESQAARTALAEEALAPLTAIEASQFALEQLLSAPLVHIPYKVYRALPPLGDVIEHLDASLSLNPTRADIWLVRGRLLDLAGDQRRARESLETAWLVADRIPDQQRDVGELRRGIAVQAAWLEREAGWWDEGLAWLERGEVDIPSDDSEAILLRGLLLAGRGDLEEAMALSFGLPPVILPMVSQLGLDGFLGLKKQKNDMLKRWLQAEVWMRRGRPDLAWSVLGEIPYWRRVTVIPHRLYQDLGLYAEMNGEIDRANLFYALAYVRREYRRSAVPIPLTSDPVIGGLPHARLNFYRLLTGTFHGGSMAAYAFSSTMLALDRADSPSGERSYLLAAEALETCLRRGIHHDEVLALRGRLRFSRGHYVLAEMDLSEARDSFASRGGCDPWTSFLLGLIAMGRDRPDEAEEYLEECLAADASLAGAWDALGVARLQQGDRVQARLAFDRSIEADSGAHAAYFNRGLLRSQEGDLSGGLEDFQVAAHRSPDNMQIARVIQLARLAQREGRQFMPGLDGVGRWSPAGVDVRAHEDGAFAPESVAGNDAWRARLAELIDEVVSETGTRVRADGLNAQVLVNLVAAHDAEPSAINRKILAHAFVWLELPDEARDLLVPHWGGDLDNDEVLLLLWLDQRAGEEARLHDLARQMGEEVALEVGSFGYTAMVRRILNEHHHPFVSRQGSLSKVQVTRAHTSYGGQWAVWLSQQKFRIERGLGSRDGNMLVGKRGRAYAIGRGGSVGGGSGGGKVRSLTAGKR